MSNRKAMRRLALWSAALVGANLFVPSTQAALVFRDNGTGALNAYELETANRKQWQQAHNDASTRQRTFLNTSTNTFVTVTGHLVTISNVTEQATAVAVKNGTNLDSTVWLGATDNAAQGTVEGTFVWVDGTPFTFTNFNTGEPNNSGGEDALELTGTLPPSTIPGGWNDNNSNITGDASEAGGPFNNYIVEYDLGFAAAGQLVIPASALATLNGGSRPGDPGLNGFFEDVNSGNTLNTVRTNMAAVIAGGTVDATFDSTGLDYPKGVADASAGGATLGTFLGSDASSLVFGNPAKSTATDYNDTSFFFDGYLNVLSIFDQDPLLAGIQIDFALSTDDAANLVIGGIEVMNNDGGHGFGSDATASGLAAQRLTFESEGFYSLSMLFAAGGGGNGLELKISTLVGGFSFDVGAQSFTTPGRPTFTLSQSPTGSGPNAILFQEIIPEPAAISLLGLGAMTLLGRRRRQA